MKIALVLNDDFSMWHFRKGLLSALVRKGYQVYAITPYGPFVERIKTLGVKHITVPIYRFFNLFADILLFIRLYRIFRKHKFDIVHTMTIKPNIYGAIAAKSAGVPKIVGLVSGLGSMFSRNLTIGLKIWRPVMYNMYRLACHCCDRVWFQNSEDLEFFVERRIISRDKTIVIKSGGVDLDEYSIQALAPERLTQLRNTLGIHASDIIILMVSARMIWPKGVGEFIGACEILRDRYPNAKFILAGPLDKGSPEAVPEGYLKEKEGPSLKCLISFRDDIKELMALADIVTLPSYYKEGVPRVLLEALAMGKPVITTDSTGCREVVENEKNGYLIAPKNTAALAQAIEALLLSKPQRVQFGSYSRAKAEKEFDERLIIDRIIAELYGNA